MLEAEIKIESPDGSMSTFVTYPDENGPHPVILFLMDAPGKRPELHAMATRLATCGFCVLLPNLYYRKPDLDGFESRDTMVEYMDSLTNQMVIDDCSRLLDWADQQTFASTGPAGVVGYCMSGPFALSACGQLPQRIHAGASIHGVRLMTEATDSPHLLVKNLSGEFYIGCAASDHWAPVEMIRELELYVKAQSAPVRVEWYPHTEHGFVFPDRAGKYHHLAAEKHWHRLIDMFNRQLTS